MAIIYGYGSFCCSNCIWKHKKLFYYSLQHTAINKLKQVCLFSTIFMHSTIYALECGLFIPWYNTHSCFISSFFFVVDNVVDIFTGKNLVLDTTAEFCRQVGGDDGESCDVQ